MRLVPTFVLSLALASAVVVPAFAAPAFATEADPANAAAAPGISRLYGADRYATAIAISANYSAGVGVVYVATGENYPDALSAAPAAAKLGGPLLLTPKGALLGTVRDEIVRLNPAIIVVVGGENAVSGAVFESLRSLAPSIRRDSGADRYETSRIITRNAFATDGAAISYVATGNNFPDALSAAAAAGSTASPVILVDGAATTVHSETSALITDLHSQTVRIAGGTAVVSPQLETRLRDVAGVGIVTRLAGEDRYGTSIAINRAVFTQASTTYLAVGTGFADALAGAALAGSQSAPLYVVPGNCIPDDALSDMYSSGSTATVLLGGPNALGDGVANQTHCSWLVPAPAPAPAPVPTPGNPGNTKNCGDFRTWREAQDWFNTYYPAYGDVAQLDADNDRIACEWLPGAPR